MRSLRLRGAVLAVALAWLPLVWVVDRSKPPRTPVHPSPHLIPVQAQEEEDYDVGSILVADRALRDPNFAATVILIIRDDDDGTMGVMLNRRTKVAVSKVLENWEQARSHSEPVFAGGPVEQGTLLALLRSSKASGDATEILSGVHLVTGKALLQKLLTNGALADRVRLYLGYAGWSADQLDQELDNGGWHIFAGNANVVFDSDPNSMWQRLIHRSEIRIARARRHNRTPHTNTTSRTQRQIASGTPHRPDGSWWRCL